MRSENLAIRDAMDDCADPARISAARQALGTLAGELEALSREVEGGDFDHSAASIHRFNKAVREVKNG